MKKQGRSQNFKLGVLLLTMCNDFKP